MTDEELRDWKMTIKDYRSCFMTDTGRRVLANIMAEAKFFEHTTTVEEQAIHNFVKTILTKLGCYHINNSVSLVNKIFELESE